MDPELPFVMPPAYVELNKRLKSKTRVMSVIKGDFRKDPPDRQETDQDEPQRRTGTNG